MMRGFIVQLTEDAFQHTRKGRGLNDVRSPIPARIADRVLAPDGAILKCRHTNLGQLHVEGWPENGTIVAWPACVVIGGPDLDDKGVTQLLTLKDAVKWRK